MVCQRGELEGVLRIWVEMGQDLYQSREIKQRHTKQNNGRDTLNQQWIIKETPNSSHIQVLPIRTQFSSLSHTQLSFIFLACSNTSSLKIAYTCLHPSFAVFKMSYTSLLLFIFTWNNSKGMLLSIVTNVNLSYLGK